MKLLVGVPEVDCFNDLLGIDLDGLLLALLMLLLVLHGLVRITESLEYGIKA